MSDRADVEWTPIAPFSASGIPRDSRFAAMDSLRDAWKAQLSALTPEEFRARRRRTLRRHAIDTGVIAQLYEVDRDQMRAFIAEGFARDTIGRSALPPESVLRIIESQLAGLELAPEIVRGERPITSSFVRELHAALTSAQATYKALSSDHVEQDVPLIHGAWKTLPNQISLGNGVAREACPPEHVQSEIDQLLRWWEELEGDASVHALVKVAWFHHRFVQIHPFADGNGRVARALTSFLMQRHGLPPFGIDTDKRDAYVDALSHADSGSLTPLATFLADVSNATMLRELEPTEVAATDPISVARATMQAIAAKKAFDRATLERNQRTFARLSMVLESFAKPWFESMRKELGLAYEHPEASASVELTLLPPIIDQPLGDDWIQNHLHAAANRAKQACELRSCVGAVKLKITVEGEWMIFGAGSYRLSPDSDLMVLVPFSGNVEYSERERFWYSALESDEDVAARQSEMHQMTRACLATALAEFRKRLVPNPV